MDTLKMKIGTNLGNVLLDIAQSAIQNGDPEKSIMTYTQSLCGFDEEYALSLLKNDYVLITDADGESVNMSDDDTAREHNRHNIVDWNDWLNTRLTDIKNTVHALSKTEDGFHERMNGEWILDYDIIDAVTRYYGDENVGNVGIHNIAAKLIAGDGFADSYSNDENVWYDMCDDVERDSCEDHQYVLYTIVRYVDMIRVLHREYMKLMKTYDFLMRHDFVKRPTFVEETFESVLNKLCKFADTRLGYHHPMCDTKLCEYKKQIKEDVLSTSFGQEYHEHNLIKKNILDGYDAGWLSPDGRYYAANGPTSNMIHLFLAENITGDFFNGDRKLEEDGWIKIHGDEIYGTFIGHASGPEEDFPYQYCPTDVQVKMICDYADKFYNGKMYTRPQIVETTDPVSTYKLRQMDKFKLHELFGM